MAGAGLRRISYSGKDKDADRAFQDVSNQLSYFGKLPTVQGVLLADQDFGSPSADGSFPINHQLGRKILGICVVSVRPKTGAASACPANLPVFDANNSGNDTAKAYVYLTSAMASGFLFSFWCW